MRLDPTSVSINFRFKLQSLATPDTGKLYETERTGNYGFQEPGLHGGRNTWKSGYREAEKKSPTAIRRHRYRSRSRRPKRPMRIRLYAVITFVGLQYY